MRQEVVMIYLKLTLLVLFISSCLHSTTYHRDDYSSDDGEEMGYSNDDWEMDYSTNKFDEPIKTEPYIYSWLGNIDCYGSVEVSSYDKKRYMGIFIYKGGGYYKPIQGEYRIVFYLPEYTSISGYGGFTTISVKDTRGVEYKFRGDRSGKSIAFNDYVVRKKNSYYFGKRSHLGGNGRPALLATLLAQEKLLKIHISAASSISASCSGRLTPNGIRDALKMIGIRTRTDLLKFNAKQTKKKRT